MEETISETELRDGNRPLRVVIAYNDTGAGQRAMRMLAALGPQLGDDIEFQPIPWSFDLLSDVDWREVAARDAVHADILILATSDADALPPDVGQWAEDAINQKRGTSAAVIALFGPEEDSDGAGSARLKAIEVAALQAGLNFFAPAPRRELNEAIARVHQRTNMVTPVLEGILHHHLSPAPHPKHNH